MTEDSGKTSGITRLPDGSAFVEITLPLPKDHWIYGDPELEDEHGHEAPPIPFLMGGRHPYRMTVQESVVSAARYAIRASTMKGQEMDFDPDALVQNLVVGLLGYHTDSGLSKDDFANPAWGREQRDQ